ncbi:MAG TPA: VTT domain-containing protein [Phycisphaerae bacterium]|nr:VTT domain-containing protein [Phycisphaerae bacterium]
MRLFLFILVLSLLLLAPIFIFGDSIEVKFSGDAAIARLRAYGPWAGAVGAVLIIGDLVLPVPATAVMTALGYLYGTVIGGLVGGIASVVAGLIAYGATRALGRRAAIFLAGRSNLQRAEGFFQRQGGYAIAVSRALPLLPEILACLAGLARMPFPKFFAALCAGSIPTGLLYASAGFLMEKRPIFVLAATILIPLIVWSGIRAFFMRPKADPT